MSSDGTRERYTFAYRTIGADIPFDTWLHGGGKIPQTKERYQTGKQLTVSESHPKNRRTGSYDVGGPFYTSRVTDFINPTLVENNLEQGSSRVYTGPVWGLPPTNAEKEQLGYQNLSGSFGDKNESQMTADGTTAISRCNPINPASQLGTSLSESYLEGIPSLPGIKLWQSKTQFLKGLGSEYLNYQFGWAPLKDEVESVRDAARQHRDLLSQYQRGEGSNTHRTYRFPSQSERSALPVTHPTKWAGLPWEWGGSAGTRQVSLVKETKRWFEGCFTYGLPSSTDSWGRALGFGSDADQLYGIALSPTILWELTPWSWAVDWFSNTGEVINNVTNFGLAGLVLRYGYMMEETIETITAEGNGPEVKVLGPIIDHGGGYLTADDYWHALGHYAVGTECVTKRRVPASPFGFSVGWEGLSPTQLAITAALGITRLL